MTLQGTISCVIGVSVLWAAMTDQALARKRTKKRNWDIGAARDLSASEKPAKRAVRKRPLDRAKLRRLARAFRHEPSIRKVQRAVVRRALAQPGLARRWLRRVRGAGWLPTVQAGVGFQQRRTRDLDREPGTPDLFQIGAVNQISYEIKLSWDLPRLIFDPNELKVVREAQRIAELRDQLVSQVTRLYFERRRLQLQALLQPASTVRLALHRKLRIAELTAALNALTGGLFPDRR